MCKYRYNKNTPPHLTFFNALLLPASAESGSVVAVGQKNDGCPKCTGKVPLIEITLR